jgi:hypothetical protein
MGKALVADKVSFPPLLSPGRHRFSIGDLRKLCVEGFGNKARRELLFSELERLVAYLLQSQLICELWVDGSFVCTKDEPDDIDLSVAFMVSDMELLPDAVTKDLIARLNGGRKFSGLLDTYLCPRFPKDDPRRQADNEDYWSDKWGKGRDNWLKGFAVVGIGNKWQI